MTSIDITPPNKIYGTFARLNYKPWYAVAEFVDNATQNFFEHAQEIADADGQALLDINLSYSPSSNDLLIRDNANGMDLDELTRAMKISTPPPDTSGRSEFGMGLKTAACWFGPVWTVETTRLGSPHRYKVEFDVESLGSSEASHIAVETSDEDPGKHFTEVRISGLYNQLVGRQIQKMKDTLRSIYRVDLQKGTVEITWNGEVLQYHPPALWDHEREDGTIEEMFQALDFELEDPNNGTVHHVTGWVGVLEKMSSSHNGFALLRRGRLILGGPGEGWRPSELSGQVGSPEWKRIVGELYMDSFPVNFQKDGFKWDGGLEDALIEAVAPLVTGLRLFARDLRTGSAGRQVTTKDFTRVVEEVQEGVQEPSFKSDVTRLATPLPEGMEREEDASTETAEPVPVTLEVPLPPSAIRATLYLKDAGINAPWLAIKGASNEDFDIVLNTRHPFVEACTVDDRGTNILGRIVLGLAIAETQCRRTHGDTIPADDIRQWLSTILNHTKV